jgi:glycosyltransferase involved in cell wall biosynthesis
MPETGRGSAAARWRDRAARPLVVAAAALGYAVTLAICRLRPRRARSFRRSGRIAVSGTFHNPNWFRSHATPLGRCGQGQVIVATDAAQPSVDGVDVRCPPRWLSSVLGRAGAKAATLARIAWRERPDLYMGFHLLPNALLALWAGRLSGRPTCYQMTAGPSEVVGGGYRADNALLRRLLRPSPLLERLALAVVREFDLVVVRGSGARAYLAARGVAAPAVITGSVDGRRFPAAGERACDLLYVGQLIERKRPVEFVEIAAAVARVRPRLRAAIVGDGPLRERVAHRAAELRLGEALELRGRCADVERHLAQARVFVLTSRSEGLSIALAEAMTAGAVPVVANVGDLADLVQSGVTGYLLEPDDRSGFVEAITRLLSDAAHWQRLSQAAAEAARARTGLEGVTALWARHLGRAVQAAGGS